MMMIGDMRACGPGTDTAGLRVQLHTAYVCVQVCGAEFEAMQYHMSDGCR